MIFGKYSRVSRVRRGEIFENYLKSGILSQIKTEIPFHEEGGVCTNTRSVKNLVRSLSFLTSVTVGLRFPNQNSFHSPFSMFSLSNVSGPGKGGREVVG